MLRVSRRIAGDEGAEIRIGDPVEQARAQDASTQPALAGDDQHAARAEPRLPEDEVNDFAMGRVLRMAVQVDAGVDLVLATADTALAG